jgi:hypothetical protein
MLSLPLREPRADKGGPRRIRKIERVFERSHGIANRRILSCVIQRARPSERRQVFIRCTGYIYVCESDKTSRIRSLNSHTQFLCDSHHRYHIETPQQHRAMQDDMNYMNDHEEGDEDLDADDDEVSTACTCHSCSSGGDDCASQCQAVRGSSGVPHLTCAGRREVAKR